MAVDAGYDAYGTDTYDGKWSSTLADVDRVKVATPDRIPFDDGTFDIVITNQVLEHVRDLEITVSELARVLKIGGTLIASMPTSESVWEAHVKAFFPHWFARGSAAESICLRINHAMLPAGKPPIAKYLSGGSEYLRKQVFYRSLRDYIATLNGSFVLVSEEEKRWLGDRMGVSVPSFLAKTITRRVASCVLVFEKSH
uniref:Methyltransferase type 11 n=1 Tax=Rhodopseudomonas palustris (strain BisA53) TaxID=316055 RepID=Q07VH4_RHOP5